MGKYDEIKVGDTAQLNHVVTTEDIERFVTLTGDDNRLHIDKVYASQTPFKRPVAHGMLGVSFISTVIGTKLPGDGALWFSQNLEFLLPVWVGDEITVVAEVIKKHDRDQVLEIRTDIHNQHKQKVTTGVAKVKIVERAGGGEPAPVKPRKTALIVGASGGIGKATAHALLRDGFDALLHYHGNRDAVQGIIKEFAQAGRDAFAISGDISREEDVKEMAAAAERHFDGITAIVNCSTPKIASIRLGALTWEDFQLHIDVNLKGAFFLARHFVPLMEREKYGKIVNIISQAVETPNADWMHYISAKSGLAGFTRALAMECAPKGIRVNLVSPGMTNTELIANIPEKARLLIEAKTPLKRLASPADVANVIAFLVSEGADHLAGETIRVNGGQIML